MEAPRLVLYVILLFVPVLISSLLHQIPEGYVGASWRKDSMTQFDSIPVSLVDYVTDVPCETKDGVMISFKRIEVVNRFRKEYVHDTELKYGVHYYKTLIHDKINHKTNHFCRSRVLEDVYIDMYDKMDEEMKNDIQADCAQEAPGIEIVSVRITKPVIPDSILMSKFDQMEGRLKMMRRIIEENRKLSFTKSEKNFDESKIQMEQKLMEMDKLMKIQEKENIMFVNREKSFIDVEHHRVMKQKEADNFKFVKVTNAIVDLSKLYIISMSGDGLIELLRNGLRFILETGKLGKMKKLLLNFFQDKPQAAAQNLIKQA